MTEVAIVGGIITAILVYLIVTHRISVAQIRAQLDLLHGKVDAARPVTAPVAVAPVPVPVTVAAAPEPTLAPAGTPVANDASNAALNAYAASGDVRGGNAGGTVSDAGAAPGDRSGFDLSVPGNVKVNVLEANHEYVFTFEVPEGCAAASVDVLRVADSPTTPNITVQAFAPGGAAIPNTLYSGIMFDSMPTPIAGPLAAGRYLFKLQISKPGPMGVVLYRQ